MENNNMCMSKKLLKLLLLLPILLCGCKEEPIDGDKDQLKDIYVIEDGYLVDAQNYKIYVSSRAQTIELQMTCTASNLFETSTNVGQENKPDWITWEMVPEPEKARNVCYGTLHIDVGKNQSRSERSCEMYVRTGNFRLAVIKLIQSR